MVLYEADWSNGLNGWPGTNGWKWLNGMLLNDGTVNGGVVVAPYDPTTANYAVEIEVQIVRVSSFDAEFGIAARRKADEVGYAAGVSPSDDFWFIGTVSNGYWSYYDTLASDDVVIDTEWHLYRIEVQDNEVRFLIDDAVIGRAFDNRYLETGAIEVFVDEVQINMRAFRVIAL